MHGIRMHKKTKLCNKNRMHTIFPANTKMQLSEMLTYAGVALVVALVYNMTRNSGAQGHKSTMMIVSLILVVAFAYMAIRHQEASAIKLKADNVSMPMREDILAEGFTHENAMHHEYPEHFDGQEEAYTDLASMQNMQSRMDAIVPKTLRGGEAYDDMPSQVAKAEKKTFAPFMQADTEYSMPLAKRQASAPGQAAGSAQQVRGNFLDVTSKEADTHGQVGTNSALLPIMEQYMKVHENDPTRSSIWQSNNGVPSYDIRDPINVQLHDFPRTVSAKLPVV